MDAEQRRSEEWPTELTARQAKEFLGVSMTKLSKLLKDKVLIYRLDPLDQRCKLIKREDLETLKRIR